MRLIPILFFFSITLLLVACSKDKFETKPRLEIKDISNDEIRQGGFVRIKLTYFDKEGDLSKAALYCLRVRTNRIPPTNDLVDELNVTLPEFPEKNTGEISLDFRYVDFLDEDPNRNDSMYFRFTVKDNAGNQSDTINTKLIVAINP